MTKPIRNLADLIAYLANRPSPDPQLEHEIEQDVRIDEQILDEIEEQDDRLDSIESKLDEILAQLKPSPSVLSSVKIQFGDSKTMALGPVTIQVGQTVTATVQGFDQNGAPFTGPMPAINYSVDNAGIASSTPSADGVSDAVAGVSAGVANLTAAVTSAEGLALSDTETVTVTAAPSVLSSIKINFA